MRLRFTPEQERELEPFALFVGVLLLGFVLGELTYFLETGVPTGRLRGAPSWPEVLFVGLFAGLSLAVRSRRLRFVFVLFATVTALSDWTLLGSYGVGPWLGRSAFHLAAAWLLIAFGYRNQTRRLRVLAACVLVLAVGGKYALLRSAETSVFDRERRSPIRQWMPGGARQPNTRLHPAAALREQAGFRDLLARRG